jgi:IclR family acetate operon transcriptional repressor
MAVKRIRGASRALELLEAIAKHQPVNLAELARQLGEDKSTLQRILMTLADEAWIRMAPGTPTRWELTARVYSLAQMGQGFTELRHRARRALDRLRTETGESIMLVVPDRGRMVTIDALECTQLVRTAPYIGMLIPPRDSASGQAVLAHMTPQQQADLLGEIPDAALQKRLAEVRRRGYAVNDGAVVKGSTNVGSAILDAEGQPVAAIVVAAPSERMPSATRRKVGCMVKLAAAQVSQN